MTDWKKVEMSPTWDYEADKELVGIYQSKEEKVGPNESNLYNIQKDDGSIMGVWGNTILDSRFKGVQVGEEVKIIYLGMEKSEKTGRSYHNFEVYHRPAQTKNTFEEN